MLNTRRLTFRVKTGDSWIRIDDCTIMYWMEYKNNIGFYLRDPHSVDIRDFTLPGWAKFLKEKIKTYLENNPEVLENSYNDKIIEVP